MPVSKNIAIFSFAYFPFVGGAEIAIKEITDRVEGRGFSFVCLTHKFNKEWKDEERMGNVRVCRVEGLGFRVPRLGKILYIFQAWRKAEELHKERPFTLIWAMMASYAGFAALLFKLKHPDIPMLLTLQEGDSERHILSRVNIFYPFWRLIFKKADYIQAISNYLAKFAKRHGARCPVEVIPNGVDIKKFQNLSLRDISLPAGDLPQGDRRETNTKIIITTSRLVYKNGIDTLIKAIAELKNSHPPAGGPITNYRLLILGDGPDRKKLENLARKLGLEDKVQFLGHIPPDEIPKYLSQADIFVRPSRSEGLGNSFLEAMAAGLPVIGTPVGGIPDFLEDPSTGSGQATGLFCRVNDFKDLAEKIAALFGDKELYKKISVNGRFLILNSYSWDDIAKRMQRIFVQISKE